MSSENPGLGRAPGSAGSLEDRLGRLVGARPVAWEARAAPWQPAAGVNERWSVLLDDGRRVFVKHTVVPEFADWLRREQRVYAALAGAHSCRRI